MSLAPGTQPAQLEFLWRNPEDLRLELEEMMGVAVELVITDNRSSLLTAKAARRGRLVRIRLHRMFLAAEPAVVRALARWLQSPRKSRAGDLLDAFIKENMHQVRAARPARILLRQQGRHFDLKTIRDELNSEYFDGRVNAHITWGRMPPQRRRRSIRYGSYYATDNLIRINPLLDQDFVPEYFVRYIVFHEMLHADLGADVCERSGRRRVHTAEFRRRERDFADYDRANAWSDAPKNLHRLLGRRGWAR